MCTVCVVMALLCSFLAFYILSLPFNSQLCSVHTLLAEAARKIRRITGPMACSTTVYVYVPLPTDSYTAPLAIRVQGGDDAVV